MNDLHSRRTSSRIRRRILSPLLAVALVAPAAGAAPTALEVGPADPPFVAALVGAGAIEQQVDALAAYMTRVGLEEPGVDELKGMLLEELKLRKGPLVKALGLAEGGAVAMYGVANEGRLEVAVAADVADQKAVIKALVLMVEGDQWVPDGDKPKRAKVERRKLPGGGLEIKVALPEERGMTARFLGDVMVMADDAAVLDQMRLGGGARPAILGKMQRGPGDAAAVVALSPQRMAELEGGEPAFHVMESAQLVSVWGPSGVDTWGELRLAEDAAPFVAIGKPSPAGAEARRVMQGLAGAGTGMWFRWSLDPKAGFAVARNMLGPALDDGIKEMKKETGLHLEKDLVDVFTGDMMFACGEGIADCLWVMGVTDGRKAAATITKALDAFSEEERRIGHETKQLQGVGAKGSMVMETTFHEIAWDWDKDKPRRLAKGERREELFRLHWATRDHALILGLTLAEVAAATGRAVPPSEDLPELLAQGRGFGDGDVMAAYQLVVDPSTLVRQILPVARGLLPKLHEGGMIVRVADAFLALQDLIVDGGSVLEVEGTTFTLRGRARPMPSAGQPGHDARHAAAYERALAFRYRGLIRSSNEALLELSEAAKGTIWAQKARTLALSGDGVGPLLMGVMSGAVTAFGLMAGAKYDDDEMMHAMPAPVIAPAGPGGGACAALEALTCSGPNQNHGSCQIAQSGLEADCDSEFKALLSGP